MNPRTLIYGIGRLVLIGIVLWGLLFLASHWLRFSLSWPLAAAAFTVALAAEIILHLYRHEARAMGPQRARRLIVLRLTALGLLAWILLGPALVRKVRREFSRELVVLWDESASMKLLDDGTLASRITLAKAAMAESGILTQLGKQLRVREVSFARGPDDGTQVRDRGWDQTTDIAGALDTVLEQVSPDELAGAILITDGRHNRQSRVEDSARRFGVLDAPLGILAVGNPAPPRDAAVLAVRSPDAIHLGDKMRISADLKFDGFKGVKAKVSLKRNQELIEEREILVPEAGYREEVKFTHIPEQGGTDGYEVAITDLPDERFYDNNSWSFETSITEARTHVLLVDSHPRWEFRYLRNLFHGRDKSVHLQSVLLHPDQVDGQPLPDVAASATRPFGDSAATRLPESDDEWRKFDVIILGDLEPAAINAATWAVISRCVTERGALLVMIAGPQHMPHALPSGPARELLPVELEWGNRTYYGNDSGAFRFHLTAEGRRHPVTRHATGATANEPTWEGFPALRWRHPLKGVKEGAEILLTAAESGATTTRVTDGQALGHALDELANHRERDARNALLVTRQSGNGKVACLLSDRTWRLREGAGDIHHHRFWGNLVRWGAGPLLRAGSSSIGLGTDQLTYTVDDPVTITVRLRDNQLNPVTEPALRAEVLQDGKPVDNIPLAPVAGSNGLHEGQAGRLRVPGTYQIRVTGGQLEELKAAAGLKALETRISVVGSHGPVEMAETAPDRALLEEAATASGGKVVELDSLAGLPPLFLTEKEAREEVRETPLWDNPLVFLLLAGALTTEWWLRRSGGLP
ncbi:MAG: hypothetical protein K9N23_05835 [Akkermansiaceae bacterium]|nr:hypothetical protein [Akkermansiaceae bacterium]